MFFISFFKGFGYHK